VKAANPGPRGRLRNGSQSSKTTRATGDSAGLIFITGTDTGVGKTLLAALLLEFLRKRGEAALAMKPFSSGGASDALLLNKIQGGILPLQVINPYSFRAPLAPAVAAEREGVVVRLAEVKARIARVKSRCDRLIVEGAGGLLAPLGRGFCLLDLWRHMGGRMVVVAPNRLGVLNHVLLTVRELRRTGIGEVVVVLMGQKRADPSAGSNGRVLCTMLWPIRNYVVNYLGERAGREGAVKKNVKKIQKTLALISGIKHFVDTATAKVASTGRLES
jgi:dethiobiotin synthetase